MVPKEPRYRTDVTGVVFIILSICYQVVDKFRFFKLFLGLNGNLVDAFRKMQIFGSNLLCF